jgi:vitamin B12/bleomycin/antimicrobial peptide transport system ATP-binding/permease protein
MRPLTLALAAFAVVALFTSFYESDAIMLGLALASAVSAGAMASKLPISAFFKILIDVFAIETIVFGLINIASITGAWPVDYKDYVPPQYLPLATALFIVVLYAISRFGMVRRMMAIADPFFEAQTSIALNVLGSPTRVVKLSRYAKACVVFLVLVNQFQVALSVRLNFFQNDFGNAIQVADEAHRLEFWRQLLTVFTPIALVIILSGVVEYFVASNFVLQWRRWMTASYTARWLAQSMHYKLALAGSNTDNPDQRISQDVGGFINGSSTGTNSTNVGFYNYTIQAIQSATNLVSFSIILWTISRAMKVSVLGVEIPGLLFWIAILYACFATGAMHLIGRSLSALFFRQQAAEANFRFDLTRIREYSEQIALLKGEDRETERAGEVFNSVFTTIRRIIIVRTRLIAFSQFYGQISVIIPYVIVAPFYYMKQVSFGLFNQSADAFGNVNSAMNFFVDRYIGFADFRATVDRLTSFDDAFARVQAAEQKTAHIHRAPSGGPNLATPNLELKLPDGRILAQLGDLVLVPQQSTLLVGPSGAGKSTLFRAIAGIWPYGSGEVTQPPYAKLMLLPQRPYIPGGSLRDAMAYPSAGAAISEDVLRATLDKVGLAAFAKRLDEVDNWQMRLSGGEQQRIAVARALIAAPDWLFLDEATSALDEDSEFALYKTIAATLPKTTVVSIGHRSTLNAFHKRRIELAAQEDGPAIVREAGA